MNKQSKTPAGSQVFVLKTGRWATVINRTATGGVNCSYGQHGIPFFVPYGEFQIPSGDRPELPVRDIQQGKDLDHVQWYGY